MNEAAVDQFEQEYAARSGTTVQMLHAWGRFAGLCDCGDYCEEGCKGFQMLHLRDKLIDAGWTPPALPDSPQPENPA